MNCCWPLIKPIFKAREWNEITVLEVEYVDVEFLRDFGHIGKGYKCQRLILDLEKLRLLIINDGVADQVSFELVD